LNLGGGGIDAAQYNTLHTMGSGACPCNGNRLKSRRIRACRLTSELKRMTENISIKVMQGGYGNPCPLRHQPITNLQVEVRGWGCLAKGLIAGSTPASAHTPLPCL